MNEEFNFYVKIQKKKKKKIWGGGGGGGGGQGRCNREVKVKFL